jgi:hypothetical protein
MSKKTWTAPTVEELGVQATLGSRQNSQFEAIIFSPGNIQLNPPGQNGTGPIR